MDQGIPCHDTGDKRDAEIDEDAFGYLRHGDRNRRTSPDAEQRGQVCDEEPCVNGVEKDLEYRVQAHDCGTVLTVALGKVIPDNNHRDTPGNSYEDKTVHEHRLVPEKNDRKGKHQHRADYPVLDKRKPEDFRVLEHFPEFLIPHLREWRVHHEDKPDRNRNRGRPDGKSRDYQCRYSG